MDNYVLDVISLYFEEFSQHHFGTKSISCLEITPLENPIGLFPRKTKNTFRISGTITKDDEADKNFVFFVKLARSNEINATIFVEKYAGKIAPFLYWNQKITEADDLFLMISEYKENSNNLWLLLNSLKISQNSSESHHLYAKKILGMLAAKTAALHFLLSSPNALNDIDNYNFKIVTYNELEKTFEKGIAFLKRNDLKGYLSIANVNDSDITLLENIKDSILDAIFNYPFHGMLHGDFQISNIIWNAQDPRSILIADWNHAYIGPQILDIYAFTTDFNCNDFIEGYYSTLKQLYETEFSINEFSHSLKASIIYQSLRLASESMDIIDENPDSNLKDSIQTTLLKRILNSMNSFIE